MLILTLQKKWFDMILSGEKQEYDEGHIIYSPEKIIVTRTFYNFMQDVLAVSYVDKFF